MKFDAVETLGLAAGLIGTSAVIPQMVKIIRTKSAEDVSAFMFSLAFTAALMWTVYGALRGTPSILIWNAVSALLVGAVLVLKLRLKGR